MSEEVKRRIQDPSTMITRLRKIQLLGVRKIASVKLEARDRDGRLNLKPTAGAVLIIFSFAYTQPLFSLCLSFSLCIILDLVYSAPTDKPTRPKSSLPTPPIHNSIFINSSFSRAQQATELMS